MMMATCTGENESREEKEQHTIVNVTCYYVDGKNDEYLGINLTTLQDMLKRDNEAVCCIITAISGSAFVFNEQFGHLMDLEEQNLIVQCSDLQSKTFVYYKSNGNVIQVDLGENCDIKVEDFLRNITKNVGLNMIIDGIKLQIFGKFRDANRCLLSANFNELVHLLLLQLSVQYDILSLRYLLLMASINGCSGLNAETLNDLCNVKCVGTNENVEIVESLRNHLNSRFALEVEIGNIDTVDFLVKTNCINVNYRKEYKSMTMIAYEKKHFDILLLLLKADALLPVKFSTDKVNENVKKFLESRNKLHAMIASGNKACLEEYIKTLSKSKLYLNSEGKSALFTSIKSRQFEIHVYLKANGLQFKDKGEESAINELDNDKKQQLKEIIHKASPKHKDSSILYLTSKSQKARSVMDEKSRKLIKSYYKNLVQFDTIRTLFSVIENGDQLSIMYDYDSGNVCGINPTVSDNAKGLTCYWEGTIYIGAKVEDETQLLGTIAHELTHLAMNIVFQNDCNPYEKNTEQETEFNQIVKSLHGKLESVTDEILSDAFEKYGECEWPRELIARVPQMLVKHNGDETGLNNQASELLQFYKEFVIVECREFDGQSHNLKMKNNILGLNSLSGIVKSVNELRIKFVNPVAIDAISCDKRVLFFNTPSTLLTIAHVHQSLDLKDFQLLLLSCVEFQKNISDIVQYLKSQICNILIIEVTETFLTSDIAFERICQFLINNSSKKMIIIENENHCKNWFEEKKERHPIEVFYKSNSTNHTIENYSLLDFDDKSKKSLFNKVISFQNSDLQLKKLIDKKCDSCLKIVDAQTLTKLLKNESVSVGKKPPLSVDYDDDYYIPRSFRCKESSSIMSETDLLNKMGEFPVILISETAGMGKTTVLTRFTQMITKQEVHNSQSSKFWVIRINLNNYTRILNEELGRRTFNSSNVENALLFLIDKLLIGRKETKLETDFERNLLLHFLNNKEKVIVMFDGFDEISPNYASIVIDLIVALNKSKVKQIWITTRPHMINAFEGKLPNGTLKTLNMLPFSKDNQRDFICKYWAKTLSINSVLIGKVQLYVKMLVRSIAESIDDYQLKFTGIPLQTKMLAVAYTEEMFAFVNSDVQTPEAIVINSLTDLYSKFIDEKFKVREVEKKKIVETIPLNQHDSKSIRRAYDKNHEIAGFMALFDQDKYKQMLLSDKELKKYSKFAKSIMDGRENTGLISEINEIEGVHKAEFVHRTFAEYFASKLIWRKMYQNESVCSLKVYLTLANSQSTLVVNSFIESLIGNLKLDEADILFKQAQDVVNSRVTISNSLSHESTPFAIVTSKGLKHVAWLILNSFSIFKNDFNPKNLENKRISDLCRDEYDVIAEKYRLKLKTSRADKSEFKEYILREKEVLSSQIYGIHWPVFNLILNHCHLTGIDVSRLIDINYDLLNALHLNKLKFVKFLVTKFNVDVNALHHPTKDEVRPLIVDVFYRNYDTALHFAAENNNFKLVDFLIDDCHSNIDGNDDSLITPLQAAAKKGNLDMVKYLINKHGADPRRINKKGLNVLHYAVLNSDWKVFDFLIEEWHLNVDGDEACFCSPLHVMAESNDFARLPHCIVKHSANIYKVAADGRNILHLAAGVSYIESIRFIVEELNFDTHSVCNQGKTALHYAAGNQLLYCSNYHANEIMDYLVDKCNIDVNVVDNNRNTPLDEAHLLKSRMPNTRKKDVEKFVSYLIEKHHAKSGKNVIEWSISQIRNFFDFSMLMRFN